MDVCFQRGPTEKMSDCFTEAISVNSILFWTSLLPNDIHI